VPVIEGWPGKIQAAQQVVSYNLNGKPVPRVRYGSEQDDWHADRIPVSKLRAVTMLEKKFAAAHPEKGFTCKLDLLRPAQNEQNPVDYDTMRFLAIGSCFGVQVPARQLPGK
jgi:hypothetical protein